MHERQGQSSGLDRERPVRLTLAGCSSFHGLTEVPVDGLAGAPSRRGDPVDWDLRLFGLRDEFVGLLVDLAKLFSHEAPLLGEVLDGSYEGLLLIVWLKGWAGHTIRLTVAVPLDPVTPPVSVDM